MKYQYTNNTKPQKVKCRLVMQLHNQGAAIHQKNCSCRKPGRQASWMQNKQGNQKNLVEWAGKLPGGIHALKSDERSWVKMRFSPFYFCTRGTKELKNTKSVEIGMIYVPPFGFSFLPFLQRALKLDQPDLVTNAMENYSHQCYQRGINSSLTA